MRTCALAITLSSSLRSTCSSRLVGNAFKCQIERHTSEGQARHVHLSLTIPHAPCVVGLRPRTQNRAQHLQSLPRVRTWSTRTSRGETSEVDDDPFEIKHLKEYTTLIGEYTVETEVKKSRFIAHASPISSPTDALEFFELVRDWVLNN
eukprot:1151120-Prorocentrum_minimum.AAC.2